MEREYRFAVYIGRFQPPHRAHVAAMKQALELADQLVVVLGSADAAPSTTNPWTCEQRAAMIRSALGKEGRRVHCIPVRDYFYNEKAWQMEVMSKVGDVIEDEENICLMVHFKDASSKYQKDFPWESEQIEHTNYIMSAIDTRERLLGAKTLEQRTGWSDKGDIPWDTDLSKEVKEHILAWWSTTTRRDLQDEYTKLKEYKDMWKGTPHPVTFVTTDALVVRDEHLLVVRRKFVPGKGLYALPGGFLKQNERIIHGTIRELCEETRIDVPKPVLERHIVETKVFDYHDRDPRGRVITHCSLIDLGPGRLPKVKGGDDAKHAKWVTFQDVFRKPHLFYADHAQIIYQFHIERKYKNNSDLLAYVRNEV